MHSCFIQRNQNQLIYTSHALRSNSNMSVSSLQCYQLVFLKFRLFEYNYFLKLVTFPFFNDILNLDSYYNIKISGQAI